MKDGVLKYISPTLDASTDTLLLRTQFDNKNNEVIVGQFVNINIENIHIPGVMSIPEVAICKVVLLQLYMLLMINLQLN